MIRRKLVCLAAMTALGAALPIAAQAQADYPNKPVKIINIVALLIVPLMMKFHGGPANAAPSTPAAAPAAISAPAGPVATPVAPAIPAPKPTQAADASGTPTPVPAASAAK